MFVHAYAFSDASGSNEADGNTIEPPVQRNAMTMLMPPM